MQLLLVLFLFLNLDLQHVQSNESVPLKCFVCESENSFDCNEEGNCTSEEKNCVIAVTKILPRFFMVSKQCTKFCPLIELPSSPPKQFLLENPLPFLYLRCCEQNLCNMQGPKLPLDTFRQQVGRAHKRRCSHAASTLLTVICTAFTGLGIL